MLWGNGIPSIIWCILHLMSLNLVVTPAFCWSALTILGLFDHGNLVSWSDQALQDVVQHRYEWDLLSWTNIQCCSFCPFYWRSVTQHHKSTEALQHRNAILRWYYSIYPLFGYCCVGTECFYICLYYLHHYPNDVIEKVRKYLFAKLPNNSIRPIVLWLPIH